MNNVLGIFFQILNFYDQQFYKVNLGNGDILFRGGVSPLRTVEDMGEGGVKKQGKSGDVLYGWSLCLIFCLFLFTSNLFTSHTLSTKAILISNITMHISRGMVLLLVLKAHFFNPSLQISCAFSAEFLGLQRFKLSFLIFNDLVFPIFITTVWPGPI